MEQVALDGNALAGPLHQHLGREMTTVRATCGHCGQTFVLAELVVYSRAPGLVGRCRHCESVVLVVTEFRDAIRIHWNRFALSEPQGWMARASASLASAGDTADAQRSREPPRFPS